MAEPVAGVIVAAGLSTRMGRPKMLLPLGGRTMLGAVVAVAEQSSLDTVIVVTGSGSADARPVADSRAIWVVNPAPEEGSITSLLAGAGAANGAAVMHLLGDMPGLDAATIDTVLAAWREAPAWAAVTGYEDGPGHPLVLSADLLGAIAERRGDKVVWSMIENADAGEVLRVAVSRPRPRDINTAEDYEAAVAEREVDR